MIYWALLHARFDRLANHISFVLFSLVMTRVTASSTTTSRALWINSRTRSWGRSKVTLRGKCGSVWLFFRGSTEPVHRSKADVSVAGWKGWHFASYGESDGVTFMQTLGATLFPAVMDVLIGLGRYIVNDDAGPDPPPPPYAAATPLAGPSDPLLKPYVSAIGGIKSLVAMTAKYPTLLHAHEATNQYLLGDDVIVVDAAAAESPNHKVWLPPGGWIEMNNERARMTFSGGLHKECPPDTVDYPNASRFFGYCQNKQYTAFAPSTNFTGRHACGEKTCAQQMYVREGSVIPTALDASSGVHAGAKDAQQDQIIAVKVYPGLCPGVAWRATQFGGPRVINCQNQTAIGGGTECPQYGRFPCEGVVVNQGAKGQINATQVRRYDEDSETMALSVALKRLQGECATCGKFVLHFMHTSPPAVLNCSLERQVRTLSSLSVATRSAHLRLRPTA